jgi:hypothetical protein
VEVRQPASVFGHWPKGMTVGNRSLSGPKRTLIPSPPGEAITAYLRDSTDNSSGTLSQFEVRAQDANRTRHFYVNPTLAETVAVYNLAVATGPNFAEYGGGTGVLAIRNRAVAPTTNPPNGGVLYVEGGALKYRGSGGTVTTLGPA